MNSLLECLSSSNSDFIKKSLDLVCVVNVVQLKKAMQTGVSLKSAFYFLDLLYSVNGFRFHDLMCSVHEISITTGNPYDDRNLIKKWLSCPGISMFSKCSNHCN